MNHPMDPKPTRWTKSSIDNFAAEMARVLDIQPGGDLNTVVENIGGEIVYGWRSLDEVSGGSIVVRKINDFTIYLSEITSPKRDRFTIAHELGHLCMHYNPLIELHGEGTVMRATREKRQGDPDHERAEWEANWFAAGFLMPRDIFRQKSANLNTEQLATYFNVSEAAAEIRKKTLGIQ